MSDNTDTRERLAAVLDALLAELRQVEREDVSDPTTDTRLDEMEQRLAKGNPTDGRGRQWLDDARWLLAELRQVEERLAAAKIELGRHLCYTSEANQEQFWRQVEERAAAGTKEPQ